MGKVIVNPNDPSLRGGIPLQRVPVIPWQVFVACALQVFKDGKVQPAIFDPQPMTSADEAFQTLRFIVACQTKKPGPIAWETVPEQVQRHFRFQDAQTSGSPPDKIADNPDKTVDDDQNIA